MTGWAIGDDGNRALEQPVDPEGHATALYDTLERIVLPLFYQRRDGFVDVMRYSIALNGSFFTAQRMRQEYVINAYGLESALPTELPALAHSGRTS